MLNPLQIRRPRGARLPDERPAAWVRGWATVLSAGIFFLDIQTSQGMADPILYVLPMLLFFRGGTARDPIIAALAVTALTVAGYFISPPGNVLDAIINRCLAGGVVWLAAVTVLRHRLALEQSVAHLAQAEAVRYALDQSAIVAATDARGRITYANDQFCTISGYSRDELLGQDHRLVNSRYHPKPFMQELWRTIGRGGIWRGEIRNRAKDGRIYWVDTTIVPLLDERGKPFQYLAIRYDVTARRAMEARLLEQAALTQLGELASVVAHEVRNPLAGLRGSLQVLASRLPDDMREKRIIGAMIERIDGLNEKVQDLLHFARPRPPRLQAVDVRPILTEAAASAAAAMRPALVSIDVTGTVPPARADSEMLREIFLNLLLNATQASQNGSRVEVALAVHDGRCRISVLDRGAGIPEDVREKLFLPFFTTKRRGTGLGLPIVKRLLDLQDGTIALNERDGGGTAVVVTLPLHAPVSGAA